MRRLTVLAVLAVLACIASGCAQSHKRTLEQSDVRRVLEERAGGFVLVDIDSDEVIRVHADRCAQRLPPCSTFKIWNTMVALEIGLVSSPDEQFYKWDGQKRFLDEWNQDLTLKQAFAFSCVPAFQTLAQRIGPERMRAWLDRISYGDGDISAGISEFWLPRPGRKTILISADEQAMLLRRLLRGELPFSAEKVSILREIMRVRATDQGDLFGKTGTGRLTDGPEQVAWFVGWVESRADGKTRPFACVMHGEGLTGLDVRATVEQLLEASGLL